MDKTLTRGQKETILLLGIGTFLEYFDLMLYVHMAVLLNELFFPRTDPLVAQLLGAFTLCSTFLLRPVGGLLIGWIGDQVGRRSTIIITTSLMAISCIVMASIGTYAEIGITATAVVILCRMVQGISSLGEVIGARLYLTEMINNLSSRYLWNGVIETITRAGGLCALVVSSLAVSVHLNWRIAFWMGAVIAVCGVFARMRLRETPEFVDFKRRMKIKMAIQENPNDTMEKSPVFKETVDYKMVLAYCLIRFIGPGCFCISFIHMGELMKQSLGMTPQQVINQNMIVSLLTVLGMLATLTFVKRWHPIKIAEKYLLLFILLLPFIPLWLNHINSRSSLTLLQFLMYLPVLPLFGPETVCFKYFPVAKRFTVLATTFGVSAAIAYTSVSFSLIGLTKYIGHYAVVVVYIPMILGFLWSLWYIKQQEKGSGRYDNYPTPHEQLDTGLYNVNMEFENSEDYKEYAVKCDSSDRLLKKLVLTMKETGKSLNIQLIEKAIVFAKKWHSGQLRKTGEPFYTHPLMVAELTADYVVKTDIIIAAILHDVVEDSTCTLELIQREFNERISEIVYRLTRVRYEGGKKHKISVQESLKNMYEARDTEALLIKQLDRLHNMYTVDCHNEEKAKALKLETRNHFMMLVNYVTDKLNIGKTFRLEAKFNVLC
ncbi:HD domain-containing protein [Rickettsiales endosymbiont of Peranema trichophorum]|uniref:MFS transporter n=1 Tax=Rickettsiales endosymbiont of Peranema trichophorum TaxID=2486577 RepID=UPI001022C08E|nr:MFS transporter [Rickettsiales endosymbiont of Peranema trichophorum]RZI46766.1 HD domain-containing protein [Rickettsiales endosymbiont of Peranema trichophorum]